MSHEVETVMFVGQPAWHGLGTVLESAPTIEEAIVASGLDWKVDLLDLCLKQEAHLVRGEGDEGDEEPSDIPARVTMRSTDRSILGVVGPEFKPLQNIDAFKFFQPFIDNGTARLEAAGSLRMGKRVAKIDCNEDLLKRYTREVFGVGNANDDDASKRIVASVLRLAEEGRGTELPGVRGTMWGAFNAVTEYLTHERGKSDDTRVESQWFGDSAMRSERALMLAIEVAGGRRFDSVGDEA